MPKIKGYQINTIPPNVEYVAGLDDTTHKLDPSVIPINDLLISPKRVNRSCVYAGKTKLGTRISGKLQNVIFPDYLTYTSNTIKVYANTYFNFSKNENDYLIKINTDSDILTLPTNKYENNTVLYLFADLIDINTNTLSYGYTLSKPSFSFYSPIVESMIPPLTSNTSYGFTVSTKTSTSNNLYTLFNGQQSSSVTFTNSNEELTIKFPIKSNVTGVNFLKFYSYSIKNSANIISSLGWTVYGIKSDNSTVSISTVNNQSFGIYETKTYSISYDYSTNPPLIGLKFIFTNSNSFSLNSMRIFGSENICIDLSNYTYYQLNGNNWTEIIYPRIYLGEVVIANGNIQSVLSYEYNGYVATPWLNINSTDSFSIIHNFGFIPLKIEAIARINSTNSNDLLNVAYKKMDTDYFLIDFLPYNSGLSVENVTRYDINLVCKNNRVIDFNNIFLSQADVMFRIFRGW